MSDENTPDHRPAAPALSQPPAVPRDAATVVLLRDGAVGMEVYLIKRSRMVDFMAGAHVFPGGRFEAADGSLEACAVRETFEEAALRLDPAALVPWARWITPEISPRRFDARFFLARAPLDQEPCVDGHEATEGLWITPEGALRSWLEDAMLLAPATAKSLEALMAHRTVDTALAAAASRPPPVVMPHVWNDAERGQAYISLPGDSRHPDPVDALGGKILRLQLQTGRYRPVTAAR